MNNRVSLRRYREDFPALSRLRNGKPPVYLDNACSTLVPRQVIEAMDEYYTDFPSCSGGRSRHWFATEVTTRIEGDLEAGVAGSRRILANLVNARSEREIIFTLNTSHAINTVALGFSFRQGDTVLITDKEHNSNLLPWLKLQKSGLIRVLRATPHSGDTFDLDAFEQQLKDMRVRLVSMALTSNTTGYTIPAKQIAEIAHRYGAAVLMDAAQSVPHMPVDVQDLDVDFLAFSLHKMCGPRGIGVLYARQELLVGEKHRGDHSANSIEPSMLGGGTVDDVTYDSYRLLEPPQCFEVGIQNYPGQIGAGVAASYLRNVGIGRIRAHEIELNAHLTEKVASLYGGTGWFRIIGPQDAANRGGILTFEVKRPNAMGIAEELSKKSNVMIRDGVVCAHSYFNEQFGKGWMKPKAHSEHRMVYRVSLYFYNTLEECDTFIDTLDEVFRERSYI